MFDRKKIKKLEEINQQTQQLLFEALRLERNEEKDSHWEEVYMFVFGRIKKQVDALGLSFDWFNPDTTYRDDVIAFVEALNEVTREKTRIIEMVAAG